MSSQRLAAWLLVVLACLAGGFYARDLVSDVDAGGDVRDDAGRASLDLIVAGPDPFYQIVVSGAQAAARDYGADLRVHVPAGSPADQTSMLARIAAGGSDGVAISPLAPSTQSQVLSKLATKTHVVTYDNDAPQSLRHCYVGTNNLDAGRLCAKALKEAMPKGATLALFIGDAERENAILRRRGFIDGLFGGPPGGGQESYPLGQTVEAGDYRVVATYLDDQNPEKAAENAALALEEHPEIDCMVGLYGYNAPACLKALREKNKLADVTVIAFDEHEETLAGIAAGEIAATVVQNPYQYGFEAVRLLTSLHKRLDHAVPLAGSGSIFLPCRVLDQDSVVDYRERLKVRIGESEPLTPTDG